jgi:hypothetical protein
MLREQFIKFKEIELNRTLHEYEKTIMAESLSDPETKHQKARKRLALERKINMLEKEIQLC